MLKRQHDCTHSFVFHFYCSLIFNAAFVTTITTKFMHACIRLYMNGMLWTSQSLTDYVYPLLIVNTEPIVIFQ